MELKRLITHFTYRIETKPEGGFIAHASDPSVPALEAPTREELQQKIQANIATALVAEFPSLKLPIENQELKSSFHIERTPAGGFSIHSADSKAQTIEGATHEEIESQFAEKLIAFVGKHFMPEMSQAFAAQGNSGDIKVFVKRKVGLVVNEGSNRLSLDLPPAGSIQPDDIKVEDAKPGDVNPTSAYFGSSGETITNSPINPEKSSNWAIFRFLLTLLIIAALMYFFFYRR
jgi:hypothetical protein